MDNFENKVRRNIGIPLEQMAGSAGTAIDNLYAKLLALRNHRQGAMPVHPPPAMQMMPTSTGGIPIDYNRKMDEEDKRNIQNAKRQVEMINKAEAPINEAEYTPYADGGTVTKDDIRHALEEAQGPHPEIYDAEKDPTSLSFAPKSGFDNLKGYDWTEKYPKLAAAMATGIDIAPLLTGHVAGRLAPTAEHPVLSKITTPEQAVALKGAERQAYLQALDEAYGPRDQRASDMGFKPETYYHGSFGDIHNFENKPNDTTPFMGRGTYLTTSPEDAGQYATLNSNLADNRYKLEKMINRFQKDYGMGDRQAMEAAQQKLTNGLDSGMVYPVKMREGRSTPLMIEGQPSFEEARNLTKNKDIAMMHPLEKWPYMEELSPEDLHVRIKDPSKIRSVNAAFDPRFKDSALLLAGKTPTPSVPTNIKDDNSDEEDVSDESPNDFINARKLNQLKETVASPRVDDFKLPKYAEGGTVNGFPQLQSMMKPSYGKATAELDASRDPMGFMEKNKDMKITGKGVAFADGGAVPEANPHDIESFLNLISQIESSGGKNTEHPVMSQGIHAGDSALGRYGLMPNTIKETATRFPDALTNDLLKMPNDQVSEFIRQKPEIEDLIAKQLAQRALTRFPDQEMAAYAWNQGTNLTPEQVQARAYQDSPYVQKFRKFRDSLKLAGK